MNRLRTSLLSVFFAVAVSATIIGASPAQASKPTHITSHSVDLICDLPGLTNADGDTVVLSLEDHSEFGQSGSILYWVAPETPETNEDSTYRTSSLVEDQHITLTGLHFDAVMGMEDRDFNPVGNATITADLVPTGEQVGPVGKTRFGNRTIRDNSVTRFLVVETGNVTLQDGTVFDIAGCPGFEQTVDITITDPSQFVISFSGILVLCDIQTPDYAMNLGAGTSPSTSTEIFFSNVNGTLNGFADDITLTADRFGGSVPLTDDNGDPAGTAVIDATFTQGDHLVVRTQDGGIRSKRLGNILIPTGTITFPGTVVDLSSCFAFDGREQQIEHRPPAE